MNNYSVIVVGGGPAAWSAALYLARADLQPLVLAGEKPGGQLMLTTVIENFPGFPNGIDGPELMMNMRAQAERFGAVVVEEEVTAIKPLAQEGRTISITTQKQTYQAKAVVIAAGAEAVWLNVPGEKELIGRGVSTCAVCDAAFFRNKNTVVVGGGDAAMEDALALSKFAKSVTIVHRRDQFKASKVMTERVLKSGVQVMWNKTVQEIQGTAAVTAVVLKDTLTSEVTTLPIDGVFVAIGHRPTTGFLHDIVQLNAEGYILTRMGLEAASVEMARQNLNGKGKVAYPTMTSAEGIFAAGDCVDFRWRQAAIASGTGIMAALDAEQWLAEALIGQV